jgi:hypothetical protein
MLGIGDGACGLVVDEVAGGKKATREGHKTDHLLQRAYLLS